MRILSGLFVHRWCKWCSSPTVLTFQQQLSRMCSRYNLKGPTEWFGILASKNNTGLQVFFLPSFSNLLLTFRALHHSSTCLLTMEAMKRNDKWWKKKRELRKGLASILCGHGMNGRHPPSTSCPFSFSTGRMGLTDQCKYSPECTWELL